MLKKFIYKIINKIKNLYKINDYQIVSACCLKELCVHADEEGSSYYYCKGCLNACDPIQIKIKDK